jgi:hypothetical protein
MGFGQANDDKLLDVTQLVLEDWQLTRTRLTQAEERMTAVLDEFGLTALVTSITGYRRWRPRRSWLRPATRGGSS